ncbi:hypothetical protein C8J27_102227 [Rhodobacter aestuarii]|uniref:Lipoprotein n=1 Tax=Rhodobacter aestuarii TaxID=453582 RepID=A0A1N7NFC9_9RHOB|nr:MULTISPECIES: hypothetical protein [Rhodobacter]PTV96433.1 hypothetical protein C8J27_102227 [Rhodobacter aestuarii]SIS97074.1 hypothetical protein SAMN05421580_107227 [Rhodobacter aestuarii]SOB92175.1 hypothetical protein SAMN05877809_101506 [Rhodobacter sp. JA431]
MKLPSLIPCLIPLALAACGGDDMRLYPLAGPIAAENPALVIPVTLSSDTETSGKISFRLPKPAQSKCTGTWTSVAPRVTTHERGFSLGLKNIGGKYTNATSDVGGVNSGEFYAVCKDGTRLEGSFIMGSGTQSGTGTVSDTRGNSYKLLF